MSTQRSPFDAGNQRSRSPTNTDIQSMSFNAHAQRMPFDAGTQRLPFNNDTQLSPTNADIQHPPSNSSTQRLIFNSDTQGSPSNAGTQLPIFISAAQRPPFNPAAERPPFNVSTQHPPSNPSPQCPMSNSDLQHLSFDAVTKYPTSSVGSQNQFFNAGGQSETGTQISLPNGDTHNPAFFLGFQSSIKNQGHQMSAVARAPQSRPKKKIRRMPTLDSMTTTDPDRCLYQSNLNIFTPKADTSGYEEEMISRDTDQFDLGYDEGHDALNNYIDDSLDKAVKRITGTLAVKLDMISSSIQLLSDQQKSIERKLESRITGIETVLRQETEERRADTAALKQNSKAMIRTAHQIIEEGHSGTKSVIAEIDARLQSVSSMIIDEGRSSSSDTGEHLKDISRIAETVLFRMANDNQDIREALRGFADQSNSNIKAITDDFEDVRLHIRTGIQHLRKDYDPIAATVNDDLKEIKILQQRSDATLQDISNSINRAPGAYHAPPDTQLAVPNAIQRTTQPTLQVPRPLHDAIEDMTVVSDDNTMRMPSGLALTFGNREGGIVPLGDIPEETKNQALRDVVKLEIEPMPRKGKGSQICTRTSRKGFNARVTDPHLSCQLCSANNLLCFFVLKEQVRFRCRAGGAFEPLQWIRN